MGYKITCIQFTTDVPLHGGFTRRVRAVDGFDIRMDAHGFVLVTRPDWSVVYHYGPNFIANLTSEPLAPPAPQEDTRITRRPKPGKQAA